jgi:hypothetical protein
VLVIATALNKEGICAVLTGEAAAAMHLPGDKLSPRLNYSLTSPASASRLASAIRHLGFEPMEGNRYRHADIGVVLELSSELLTIGRNTKVVAQTLQLRHGFVRILSATDCCREQLLQSRKSPEGPGMQSAVNLAKHCDINMADMRAWMRTEGFHGVWPDFKAAVAGTNRHMLPAADPRPRVSRLR